MFVIIKENKIVSINDDQNQCKTLAEEKIGLLSGGLLYNVNNGMEILLKNDQSEIVASLVERKGRLLEVLR